MNFLAPENMNRFREHFEGYRFKNYNSPLLMAFLAYGLSSWEALLNIDSP